MDRITKNLLGEFKKTFQISNFDDSEAFEAFCNYSIISNQINKTFAFDAISTGGGNDTGIDGIGIIVNGHLVEEESEINDLITMNGLLDICFIFIQAKTSTSFDSGEILKFYHGIYDFFSDDPKMPRNESVEKFANFASILFNNTGKFRANPAIKTFYVTAGVYKEDANFISLKETHNNALLELNLFTEIETNIIGARDIVILFRKSQNPISATFIFSDRVALQTIDGVEQAYYGVLPFKEFRKLLMDENGNLLSVFDDNVRDYQGEANLVNSKIAETLCSENPNLFSVLNNGVTIVTDTIRTSGHSVTISGYQIVNGCQTSNVLFANSRLDALAEVYIPLRIIATQNSDVRSQITVSTNNQTAIKKEQLSAMSEFQKNLEAYYNTRAKEMDLKYERRARQYATDTNVTKRKIITIANQVKSFSSMFRQDPHLVTTYFGTLAKSMGEKGNSLCEADHQYAAYYMSGLAYYKLDLLFSIGVIDKKYKKVRFYLLMLFLMISKEGDLPPLNSEKKVEKFSDVLIKKLLDESICIKIFQKAAEIIDRSGAKIEDKQALKSRPMTLQILNEFKESDRI